MNVYIWEEPTLIADVLTTEYNRTVTNVKYWYGVCFTANNDCTLAKINILCDTASGYLRIVKGNVPTSTTDKADYTISAGGDFILPTPYPLTANTDYMVLFSGSNIGYNDTNFYPKTGTNVTFKYGSTSYNSGVYTYVAGLGAVYTY